MLRIISSLTFLIALILISIPIISSAHGGVEKSSGNVTVFLSQSPSSPLVGEKVKMTFVFANKSNVLERIKNLDVEINLLDTFFNDATKDKTIFTEHNTTDANGAIEFEYTFNKENYFDVDLKFRDPTTNNMEELGFLIQVRTGNNQLDTLKVASIALVGLIAGVVISLFYRKYEVHK